MRKQRPLSQQVSASGRDGRDPSLLGDQMDRLLVDRGWTVDVAVGAVMGRWPANVGQADAEPCTPRQFSEGGRTVRADTVTWATLRRRVASTL